MAYSDLLRDPRWQKKRLEILERDGFKCKACGDDKTELHVHHCTYQFGVDPWDVQSKTLVTLCKVCHKDEEALKNGFDLVESMKLSGIPTVQILHLLMEPDKYRNLMDRVTNE